MQCQDTDQPSAGLVKDLKRLGLLEDTLVIWGGEFSRTILFRAIPRRRRAEIITRVASRSDGRRRRKGRTMYSETDDFGYNVAKDGVHVHDLQALIMRLPASITRK